MNASALVSRSPLPDMCCDTLDLRLLRGLPSTHVYDFYLGRHLRKLLLGTRIPEYPRAFCIVYDLRVEFSISRTRQR